MAVEDVTVDATVYVVTYSPFHPEGAYETAVAGGALSPGHILHPSASWEARVAFRTCADATAYAASRNLELYVDSFAAAKLTAAELRDVERAATADASAARVAAPDARGTADAYRHAYVVAAADLMQLKLTPEHSLLSVAAGVPGGWRVHPVRGPAAAARPECATIYLVSAEPHEDPADAYAAGRYEWRLVRFEGSQATADARADRANVRAYVAAHSSDIPGGVAARIAALVDLARREGASPAALSRYERALQRKALSPPHGRDLASELRFKPGGYSVAALALE